MSLRWVFPAFEAIVCRDWIRCIWNDRVVLRFWWFDVTSDVVKEGDGSNNDGNGVVSAVDFLVIEDDTDEVDVGVGDADVDADVDDAVNGGGNKNVEVSDDVEEDRDDELDGDMHS